ncbi:MAG: DMT family transporter [Bacillota bacterium]
MSHGLATAAVLAAAVGVLIGSQGAVNAALSRYCPPLVAALVSFSVGAAVLLVLVVAIRPGLGTLTQAPPGLLLGGGLMGTGIVVGSILLVQMAGAGRTTGWLLAAQLTAALALDHFGLLGLPVRPFTTARLLGAAFLLAGALLVRW